MNSRDGLKKSDDLNRKLLNGYVLEQSWCQDFTFLSSIILIGVYLQNYTKSCQDDSHPYLKTKSATFSGINILRVKCLP